MGMLRFVGDIFEDNAFVKVIGGIATGFLLGANSLDYLHEDYDPGTDDRDQAYEALSEEIAQISALNTLGDLQKEREVLALERQLDEKKNGAWTEYSDQDIAYQRANNEFNLKGDMVNAKLENLGDAVARKLLLNSDISEKDYASLSSDLYQVFKEAQEIRNNDGNPNNDTENAYDPGIWGVGSYAVRECQLDVAGEGQMSISAQFEKVSECAKSELDSDGTIWFFSSLGSVFAMAILGMPALGAGLNGLDRKIQNYKNRPKKIKTPEN